MLAFAHTRYHQIRKHLEQYTPKTRTRRFLWEFLLFGFKQGWACLFGGLMLGLLLATKWLWPADAPVTRYDFLFICAVTIQLILLLTRMETVREAKVIFIFHVIGTCMEVFKTSVGSWSYPENSVIHIGHVPLFSGFMYASVGSYLARVSRIFDMRYTHYPKPWQTVILAVLIYANFFLHHYLPDIRVELFALTAFLFRRTWVYYRPYRKFRRMPLLLGFALVALFIWGAENIGTFAATWLYPHQQHGWQMVQWGKYGSWLLLMIISFILVSFVHPPREPYVKEAD